MAQYLDHLRSVPLFAGLDDKELKRVASHVTDLDLPEGRVIMPEGTASHEMVIVVSGSLSVEQGDEQIATIPAGGVAGEMGLLTQAPRSSTVKTAEPSEVLHIDGKSFQGLLDDVPEIAVKLLPIVAERVHYSIEPTE